MFYKTLYCYSKQITLYLNYLTMRIVTFSKIKLFVDKHADADVALRDWYFKTKRSEWNNLNELKQTFATADYIGNNRFVFNIKGNDYRLVAIVIFASKKVYIRFIGTHATYDKTNCLNI